MTQKGTWLTLLELLQESPVLPGSYLDSRYGAGWGSIYDGKHRGSCYGPGTVLLFQGANPEKGRCKKEATWLRG